MTKRKVLITGASNGVGHAIAKRLYDEGYELYLISRSKPEGLPRHTWLKWDLSDTSKVARLLQGNDLSGVDVFVGNAGILLGNPPKDYSLDDMNTMTNIHVISQALLCNYLLNHMARRKFGRIVLIGSSAAETGHPDVMYAATKAAVASLAQSYAELYRGMNVTVNCIQPGAIKTDITKNINKSNEAYLTDHTIIASNYLSLDELADVTLNLIADSNVVTGTRVNINFNALWKWQ